MGTSPQELRAEQRWSSFQERPAPWTAATDERLVALVTRSTASGERFPVGVNWLEVSRAVGRSPVECVKRYALLHQRSSPAAPPTVARLPQEEPVLLLPESPVSPRDDGAPFSGLSSSEGGGSPRQQSFSGFSTPLASPKLSSLDTSDEFGVGGIGSPGSPPPFAVRNARQNSGDAAAVSSPFKWEALLSESAYSSPRLKSPVRSRAPHLHSGRHFGGDDEVKDEPPLSAGFASGVMSPRIIHGTQDHTRPMLDPDFAANILSHAFKGVQVTTSAASSPRMIRTAPPSSEFPFLREDETKRAVHQPPLHDATAPAFLASPRADAVPILASEQQLQAHMLKMSAMSTMSSFHGDNPFSGSLTQSALEDAFLDMAGSRLDASSVLLGSRFSMNPSRLRTQGEPAAAAAAAAAQRDQQQES